MWWVVNQPSNLGGRGPQQTNYVVVQSAARPPNAVAGPFPTQAAAQAWQTSANTAGNSPGSAAGGLVNAGVNATGIGALGDLAHRLTESQSWIRAGEVLAGLILLYVGLRAEFPQTVNTIITQPVKGTVRAARAGLI